MRFTGFRLCVLAAKGREVPKTSPPASATNENNTIHLLRGNFIGSNRALRPLPPQRISGRCRLDSPSARTRLRAGRPGTRLPGTSMAYRRIQTMPPRIHWASRREDRCGSTTDGKCGDPSAWSCGQPLAGDQNDKPEMKHDHRHRAQTPKGSPESLRAERVSIRFEGPECRGAQDHPGTGAAEVYQKEDRDPCPAPLHPIAGPKLTQWPQSVDRSKAR
jgi:hypothetical protein